MKRIMLLVLLGCNLTTAPLLNAKATEQEIDKRVHYLQSGIILGALSYLSWYYAKEAYRYPNLLVNVTAIPAALFAVRFGCESFGDCLKAISHHREK